MIEKKKQVKVQFRITVLEYNNLCTLADKYGYTVSKYIRVLLARVLCGVEK